jgi:hypothetical protein
MATLDPRKTKIVATIGPASSDKATMKALVEAGANAMRLNFSHGSHEEHAERARLIREVEEESGWRTLAVIADLQGPKLRVAELPAPVTLALGEEVVVAGADQSEDGMIPVAPTVIGDVLRPGHEVLIDDGHVRLRVEEGLLPRARFVCDDDAWPPDPARAQTLRLLRQAAAPVSATALRTAPAVRKQTLLALLQRLAAEGVIRRAGRDGWTLTSRSVPVPDSIGGNRNPSRP